VEWIYLSPHFDDCAFSCGGLIWEQSSGGDNVQVWTICAGDVPAGALSQYAEEHHQRWQTGREAVELRKMEDMQAFEKIGAAYRFFPVPDCIYRRGGERYWAVSNDNNLSSEDPEGYLYTSSEAIFGSIHPAEVGLIQQLGEEFSRIMPEGVEVVCPLAIGGHVDHRLTRAAAESLGRNLWYYADFPYVMEKPGQIDLLIGDDWKKKRFEISMRGLEAWYDSIAAHKSQISTFWEDLAAMKQMLKNYVEKAGGARLWQKVAEQRYDPNSR
jgi:LmbE family N-acetylglucosaminyl deacetylase